MRFFFADDARQRSPTREGMHSLVAIGGYSVPFDKLRSLESTLSKLCHEVGFPGGQEFKWSPPRGSWMRDNLIEGERLKFFRSVIAALATHEAVITVVASDTDCNTATGADTHEMDVTKLFLERAHIELSNADADGVVIVDRPGGGRSDEEKFLLSCVEFLEEGSEYIRPDRFSVNVLCGSSRFVRCLQAADIVASCCLSRISGESTFSTPVFEGIRSLFRKNQWGYVGGSGLKLHPDGRLMNLYYWLLGEKDYVRGNSGVSIPKENMLYFDDDGTSANSGDV